MDGHAYTVLSCVKNVAGTDFNLAKVRNPWGQGEFESGQWDDDGPGWSEHPEVKDALKPDLGVDDGIFWVTREEFFQYFKTVYLSASDMTAFLEPTSEQEKATAPANEKQPELASETEDAASADPKSGPELDSQEG